MTDSSLEKEFCLVMDSCLVMGSCLGVGPCLGTGRRVVKYVEANPQTANLFSNPKHLEESLGFGRRMEDCGQRQVRRDGGNLRVN